MKWLQKLGKALMLPVACLPICGILMGIGYLLCPSTMQGGDVVGFAQTLGFFLVKAGGALIDNIAILFVIGVGVGMSDKNDGTGGLAALASWLMMTTLLSTGRCSRSSSMVPGGRTCWKLTRASSGSQAGMTRPRRTPRNTAPLRTTGRRPHRNSWGDPWRQNRTAVMPAKAPLCSTSCSRM